MHSYLYKDDENASENTAESNAENMNAENPTESNTTSGESGDNGGNDNDDNSETELDENGGKYRAPVCGVDLALHAKCRAPGIYCKGLECIWFRGQCLVFTLIF